MSDLHNFLFLFITRYIFNANYEFYAAVGRVVAGGATTVKTGIDHVTSCCAACCIRVCEFLYGICEVVALMLHNCWNAVVVSHNTIQNFIDAILEALVWSYNLACQVCAAVTDTGSAVAEFISNLSTNMSAAVCSCVSAVYRFMSSLGSNSAACVTGVWQGLGYILSSVAYIPVFCSECVEAGYKKFVSSLYCILTSFTKETYLTVIVACLVYLSFSNALRYFFSKGVSLFPRRSRNRRRRQNNGNSGFHIDINFESDYEDLFGSDNDDSRVWVTDDLDEDNDGEGSSTRSTDSNSDSESENERFQHTPASIVCRLTM